METKAFVNACKDEKNNILNSYFTTETCVSEKISLMELTDSQKETLKFVLDQTLTDAFYTILMALSGEASLGTIPQQKFLVKAADGRELFDLADEAYAAFYEE